MTLHTSSALDYIGAIKDLLRPILSFNQVSGQFQFTEYQTPPNSTTTYQLAVNNADLTQGILFSLFGDGSGILQFGDLNAFSTWLFNWTPDGGNHIAHFSIDSMGKPHVWIDFVGKPVTFLGFLPTLGALFPANMVGIFGGAGDPAAASSPVQKAFVTMGNVGPETNFCCPTT
jgi:hypothetical protein